MDPIESLLAALEAQRVLVGSAACSDLSGPSKCQDWTTMDVLAHSVAVTLRFASFALGETDRPSMPEGDLIGRNPASAIGAAVALARRAWKSADRTRICHLSFGTFEAEAAAGVNLVDVLAHGWDMSPLQGRVFFCADEVWEAGLLVARALMAPGRDHRHYGPELVAGPNASIEVRFLAFLGRQ